VGAPGDTGISVAPQGHDREINDFTLIGMQIRDFPENGIWLTNVHKFRIAGGIYANNREYGIFPIFSRDGTIEYNSVTGANDTGIYIGQSSNVLIGHNDVRDCTVGFEIENSTQVTVIGNYAAFNATGYLIDVLPGLVETATTHVTLSGNEALNNNRANPVSDPEDVLSLLPSGAGILNVGADKVTIESNQVSGNNSMGIGVVQLPPAAATADPRIDPFPDNNRIVNNIVVGNGRAPDPKLAAFGLLGADLVWDGSGKNNCWSNNVFNSSYPASLPSCR
jgi:parallel beta-helix repeat protein